MALDLCTVPGLERITIPLPNSRFPKAVGMQEAHIYGKQFINYGDSYRIKRVSPKGRCPPEIAINSGDQPPVSSVCR